MQLKAAALLSTTSMQIEGDSSFIVRHAEMGEIHKWQMAVRHAIRNEAIAKQREKAEHSRLFFQLFQTSP